MVAPINGWTIPLRRARASGSSKTIRATASRSSDPSAARTVSPNASTTCCSPGVPGATTSRATASASTTTAPSAASRRATSLLPEPMPPVSPTTSIARVCQGRAYDPRVGAGNRFSTWFDGMFEDWAVTSDGPFPHPDLRFFAAVCRELDRSLPEAGLHVVATNDLRGPLPVTGDHVVVLCVGDELGRAPVYAGDVRLVAKTMGGAHRPPYVALWPPRRWPQAPAAAALEARVQLRRLPWVLRDGRRRLGSGDRPAVLDVPMGIR